MKFQKLFEPKKINSLEIQNRLIVPAMVTNFSHSDNTVSEKLVAYLAARARGGFGLIITEDFAVHPLGKGFLLVPGLWSDEFIKGCATLTQAVHREGSKIFAQIYHAGAQTHQKIIGTQPLAPSAILHPAYKSMPRALTREQIQEIIECFGLAAYRAREAGFDGVEVHGSHGYLVAQFMSPYTNKRTDEFGGDIEGRLRFPVEIIKIIRKVVGKNFPVILRLAGDERLRGGRELEETRVMAPLLEEAGYDSLHVTTATTANMPYIVPCYYAPPALNTAYAEVVKRNVSIPVITTGRIFDPFVAEAILRENRADFIGMGRSSIADPDLPRKVWAGNLEDIRPCIGCLQGCVGFLQKGEPITCLANAEIGMEREMEIKSAARKKRILVAGGGPAGLEFARVAALMGHEIVLYEKSNRLGGQLNLACVSPQKNEIAKLIRYMCTQVNKAGVKVHLGKEVTPDMAIGFDAVVVATGGRPHMPDIPGLQEDCVKNSWDILSGAATIGKKVAVVGGGLIGCELALFLAAQSKKVTVIEMLDRIAADALENVKFFLLPLMEGEKIKVCTQTKVISFFHDGVKVQMKDGPEEWRGFDAVVLAIGTCSVDELSLGIKKKFPAVRVLVIGDAWKPRNALEAIAEGARLGLSI